METSTHVYVHLICCFGVYGIWRILGFQKVSVELNAMISRCTSFIHKCMTFYGDKLDLAEATFRQKYYKKIIHSQM